MLTTITVIQPQHTMTRILNTYSYAYTVSSAQLIDFSYL